ncbi:MAG: lipopolysaccharide biosynthesis protein [Nitrospira sp.]
MSFIKRIAQFLDRSDGSLQRKAIRSGVWVGLSSAGVAVLSFARSVILARLLTPEIFGLMAICSMSIRMIEIFTETGFGAALIHRQQRFEDARDTAFTLMVLRGVGLSILAFFIAPWAAAFYNQPILDSIVAVVGISFILSGCQNVNVIALQKELDFKRLTYFEQAGSVLNFFVSVGFAYVFRSVWALVYAQIAAAAINAILSFVMLPGRVRFRFNYGIAQELFHYGKFITGLAIVVFLTRELDNLTIGKLLGMDALGYYVVAYTLANIPSTYLSAVLAKVLFPMFSKLQADTAGLGIEYGRGMRVLTAVAVPLSVGIAVLAPEIVAVLYGSRWALAAAPLQILAVFGCFRALWMLNGYLYNAIGKPQIDFYVSLSRLMVMGALLYPLTVSYGIVGASVAVAMPMVVQFFVGVFLSKRFIGVSIAATLRPLAIAIGQGAVLVVVLLGAKLFVPSNPVSGLVILMMLGAAACLMLNVQAVLAVWRSRTLREAFSCEGR